MSTESFHRKPLKLQSYINDQQKRQQLHLQRQKQQRAKKLEQQRTLSSPTSPTTKQTQTTSPSTKTYLQFPEWMLSVPNDISQQWCCKPRPEGKRVQIVTSQGHTISKSLTSKVYHSFVSALPKQVTILDAIVTAENVYYVLDVICWKGYYMVDCSCEFRYGVD